MESKSTYIAQTINRLIEAMPLDEEELHKTITGLVKEKFLSGRQAIDLYSSLDNINSLIRSSLRVYGL